MKRVLYFKSAIYKLCANCWARVKVKIHIRTYSDSITSVRQGAGGIKDYVKFGKLYQIWNQILRQIIPLIVLEQLWKIDKCIVVTATKSALRSLRSVLFVFLAI